MEPKIGDWWAACCIEDLYEIRTNEDLEDVLEWLSEEDFGGIAGLWPTREAALADLDLSDVSALTRARLGI
jgi:hypothetical protein